MDTTRQPGINMLGIILVSEDFKREKQIPDDTIVAAHFHCNYIKPDNIDIHNMEITTKVTCVIIEDGQEKVLWNLECVHIGIFQPIKDEENLGIEQFMTSNSPVIMFPYIREHVSSVTQKAGFKPVYIAPINYNALLKNTPSEQKE